jgi:valyl-tRNA synthetase
MADSEQKKPLTKNQEKNEAKRRAKMEKFLAKQKKQQEKAAAASQKKEKKEKKEKKPVVEEFVNTTKPGEKKDLSAPLAASYNPKAVEAAWYQWWEKQGFFKPEIVDGKPKKEGVFMIPIPPPNVTGTLHLGHALTNAIQDCLVRWNRMQGKTTLWNPGCDHAGIATQVVVEKKLMRERNLTRHDLGRGPFIDEVWKWKEEYGNHIFQQLRRLGSSFDWDRTAFTMDEKLSRAVKEAFYTMHKDGLIYRSNRLVNWCTKLRTALSNLEVENKELEGRTLLSVPDHDPNKKYEFGVLISFAYLVEDTNEEVVVATTRIETMLGDTAIAVHPDDERYKHLIGKYVVHPFNGRRIQIIADEMVERDFGTGCVKITPAHDFNDYEVGKRHNLEFINILNDDGTINENGAPFTGLKRFDAREAVIKKLKELGLYKKTEDNKMVIPICGRSGNIVEPMLKPQWWVKCKDMAAAAANAVRNGEIEIQPKLSEREWFKWLDNCQDWCVSRQLWWGHQIPAYLVNIDGKPLEDKDESWVCGRSEEEALQNAYQKFSDVPKDKITLSQDPDVLDTWFSSGLWPFSILGWPDQTKDMEIFYPNSILETGWDILFFWVARMVMMGIRLTGKVPFKRVFTHAMVRDAHGRKMSKSLGNVIDPIDVIEGISLELLQTRLEKGNLDPREVAKAKEGQKKDFPNGIPECGTDALRFALCAYTSTGRDINLDINRVEGYRKFCNKLWNVTRFALMKLGDDFKPRENNEMVGNESLVEKWIISRLNVAIKETTENLETINLMNATTAIYNFWLYELCDVYVEAVKPIVDADDSIPGITEKKLSMRNTLYNCLEGGLKLLHPFMPFITEELYQRLTRRPNDTIPTIMKASYPVVNPSQINEQAEKDFDIINQIIHASRSLVVEYNIRQGTIYTVASNKELASLIESQSQTIVTLVKGLKEIKVIIKGEPVPAGCSVNTLNEDITVMLLVKGFVDFDGEIAKLEKKQKKTQNNYDNLLKKTQVPDYETKVKEEIREVNSTKLKALEAEIEAITKAIQNFMKLRDE